MTVIAAALAVLIDLSAATVQGQGGQSVATNDPCGCNASLLPTLIVHGQQEELTLAFLVQVDETQYKKLKRDGAAGVVGELVGGSASYSQFDEKRRSHLSSKAFSLSSARAESLLISTVKTDDWLKCKTACAQAAGLACYVSDLTDTRVAVTCAWKPTSTDSLKVHLEVDANKLEEKTITAGGSQTWQVQRDPCSELLITAHSAYRSETLKIGATPRIDVRTTRENVKVGVCVGHGEFLDGIRFYGPSENACNGNSGWGVYSGTPAPHATRLCACSGHGSLNGVVMWGPEGESCGYSNMAWGRYDQRCVEYDKLVMCSCRGQGKTLEGQDLWGPRGEVCGGLWGPYSNSCVSPQTKTEVVETPCRK